MRTWVQSLTPCKEAWWHMALTPALGKERQEAALTGQPQVLVRDPASKHRVEAN